jgi:hypothetical protein
VLIRNDLQDLNMRLESLSSHVFIGDKPWPRWQPLLRPITEREWQPMSAGCRTKCVYCIMWRVLVSFDFMQSTLLHHLGCSIWRNLLPWPSVISRNREWAAFTSS